MTDWWHQQEEMHSHYADLPNVACNIFCIIPHGVRVEASASLGRDLIGWRQPKTTGETVPKNVFVTHIAPPSDGILPGDDRTLDTTNTENDLEMKNQAEER